VGPESSSVQLNRENKAGLTQALRFGLRLLLLFLSRTMVERRGDGGMTVTACDDKAGTDESSKRAAGWVEENVTGNIAPPAITEGSTVLDF
jgi:hypothetical protein